MTTLKFTLFTSTEINKRRKAKIYPKTTIDKYNKAIAVCRVFAIYSRLSLANFSSFCELQSTVTNKFTENLLVTDDCQQQISRLLASDSRLSPASSKLLYT